MQQLRAKTKSLTFPPLSIARYSFILPSQLGCQWRERKCPIFETVAKGDSNPAHLIASPAFYRWATALHSKTFIPSWLPFRNKSIAQELWCYSFYSVPTCRDYRHSWSTDWSVFPRLLIIADYMLSLLISTRCHPSLVRFSLARVSLTRPSLARCILTRSQFGVFQFGAFPNFVSKLIQYSMQLFFFCEGQFYLCACFLSAHVFCEEVLSKPLY